jgi:hypothetical protein
MKKLILLLLISLPSIVFAQQLSYNWSTGDTTANISPTPLVTTTYYVTVTQYGVAYFDSVTVVVNTPDFVTDNQVACDSFYWAPSDTTFYNSLVFVDTLTNGAGCDSVVTLDLTINNSNTGTDIQTACDTYTWIDGVTYTASTSTPTFTLTNTAGCDSVVTLDLTINNSNTGTDIQTACDSYTWIDGVTYTASTSAPTFTLTNAAGCDSVVTLNLTINNSNTGTDIQTACDTYTWIDGVTYTASTSTPTFTLTNASGCDSVVTLNLTINNSNAGTDIQTACDTYTWIDGVTYTASTSTPTFTLANAAGCDSMVTLNLTINNSNTGTDIQTACDTYTWIDGVTYTASTSTPTFTLTNAVGCDSVVTLNLTINNSNTGTDIQTACDTYTWMDGITYTASTSSPTFTLTNAVGCDSVVTLNLTINNSNTGTDIQTACDSYTWIDGVTYTASTSTPTFTLTNASGCDSVVTLDLTINNSNAGTDIQTACDTYTWIDGVTYTASTSTPTFTLTNAAGCDSLVTLNLTINNSNTGTDIQTACDTYTWIDGVTYTASTSTPMFTLTNAAGCDSVVTLNLTINNSVLTQIDTLSVAQYTWAINGITYTTSGIYYDTLTTTTGCDSIVELTLTIVPPLNLDVCSTDTAICIGSTITLSVTVNQAVANPAQLEVGYYYEGGIIAYIFQPTDLGYVAGETHGVIIAENDIETKLTWGGSVSLALFSTLSNEIGTGVLNTQRILFVADSLGINYPAAEAANNYSSGCFNDWILPSEFDLLQIRSNVAQNGLGNFNTSPLPSQFETGYWSSSITTNGLGALAPFMDSTGGTCDCAVFESYWVRPVRYF